MIGDGVYRVVEEDGSGELCPPFVAHSTREADQVVAIMASLMQRPVRLVPVAHPSIASAWVYQLPPEVGVTVFLEPPDAPTPAARQSPKYPNDCPCGICARDCDYHRDL